MSQEQDKIFFRNYSIIIVILAISMVVFFILAQKFATNDELMAEQEAQQKSESTAKMMEDTAPVGEVSVTEESAAPEATAGEEVAAAGKSGEEVYNGMCGACHSVAGIGAPVVGDADEWKKRLDEKGIDMIYANAINGFVGESGMMPARGGGQFSDDEVKAAVDYMLENSNAAANQEVAAAAGKSGEEVYNGMCVACHSVAGIGAPVVGDADEWKKRLDEKGIDMIYANAINGFVGEGGMMPARGGGQFSDDEVKAAVDYMLENSK